MALKGDFIGFSFNGVRSETLGIMRVSDGSRYNEDLLPSPQSSTYQVPGSDGSYYFGTDYTQKTFSVPIAFDEVSETQFRKLRETFNTKEICRLVFDERPYKYYMCAVSNFNLKYLCFDDKTSTGVERVYKGEGTISFVAYYPFAKSVHKYLSEYDDTNKDEWASSSRMLESKGSLDVRGTNGKVLVYNAGDREMDWELYFQLPSNASTASALTTITLENSAGAQVGILSFSGIKKKGNDTIFRINSSTNLIEGGTGTSVDNFILSGNLYNEYLTAGEFLKIPTMGQSEKYSLVPNTSILGINYDYIYY